MRVENGKRIVSSWFIAILIAVLLWQTRWPSLHVGLLVLLVTQAAIPVALQNQNRILSRDLNAWESTPPDEHSILHWFALQERSVGRLAAFENLGRLAGFALLAYGFWVASGYIWLAIGLGLIYPVIIYFGVTRNDTRRRRQELRKRKQELNLPQ